MKTMLKFGLGVIYVLSLLGCQGPVDKIVDKYIEATGGRAAQQAVKSQIIRGDAYIASAGLESDWVQYYKNGNFRFTVEVPGMDRFVQGVTGDIAWELNNPARGNSVLQGDEAASVREDANLNLLLNWQEIYESSEVMGEEDGATVVVFVPRNGAKTTRHFDNASGLLTKEVRTDPSGNSRTNSFSDYKKVGDLNIWVGRASGRETC